MKLRPQLSEILQNAAARLHIIQTQEQQPCQQHRLHTRSID